MTDAIAPARPPAWGLILLIWALQGGIVALAAGLPPFWDNVLHAGQLPLYFYDHPEALFPPEALAGYPPLWAKYLAWGWGWMGGRSLWAAHLLSLPLLWAISYGVVRITQRLAPARAVAVVALGALSHPVLLSVSVQTGPDLPLLAGALLGLSAILYRRRWMLALCLCLLVAVSPRGLLMAAALVVVDQALLGPRLYQPRLGWAVSRLWAYLPAALVAGTWYGAQYRHFGWWVTNPNGEWATLATFYGPVGVFRQWAVTAWRLVDLGLIVPWVMWGAFVALPGLRRRLEPLSTRPALAVLTLGTLGALVAPLAIVHNPIGHRYLVLPGMLMLLWLGTELAHRWRYARFLGWWAAVVGALLLGHLVILAYPEGRARGWDASLLHLRALAGKARIVELIAEHGIPPAEIGAFYPDARPLEAQIPGAPGGPMGDPRALPAPAYVLLTNATNELPPDSLASYRARYPAWLRVDAWPVWYELRGVPPRVAPPPPPEPLIEPIPIPDVDTLALPASGGDTLAPQPPARDTLLVP